MNKIFLVVLSTCFTASIVLAGCQGNSQPKQVPQGERTPQSEVRKTLDHVRDVARSASGDDAALDEASSEE